MAAAVPKYRCRGISTRTAVGPFLEKAEAAVGGPIAALQDGDWIIVDTANRTLSVRLTGKELKNRLSCWTPLLPKFPTGGLAKYAKLVSLASQGAVCR